jgi:hypothetical protein
MTEVKEKLNADFEALLEQDKYCKAEEKQPAEARNAKINKWGTRKKCSGKQLYENMKPSAKRGPNTSYLSAPEPFVAKPGVKKYKWDLDLIAVDHFPVQAHHIIPKNYLPGHGVCAFLAKGYKTHPKIQLTADTYYDTDHSNNGYCMPYATPLAEWKRAKSDEMAKIIIACRVMDKTGRQLHQGSHLAGPYTDPVHGHEDDGAGKDDDPMHEKGLGYLDTVGEFLNTVQAGVDIHVLAQPECPDCSKKKKKGKVQLPPIDSVVRHVDQVSGLVKLLLDSNRIFVSALAHFLWSTDRKTLVRPDWLPES